VVKVRSDALLKVTGLRAMQSPVESTKGPEMNFTDWTHPVNIDLTHLGV
jgi:hypothetical protein